MNGDNPSPEREGDFRNRATLGVALAALLLLLPFTFVSLARGHYLIATGTGAIVFMLALCAMLVIMDRDHERPTLYVLVPGGMLFMTQVFEIDAFVGALWCYPAILGVYCMLAHRRALAANAIILVVALPMSWQTLEPSLAARVVATLIAVSVFADILVREIDAMRARLRYQIEHDPLTGLLNRTSLRRRLDALTETRPARPPAALLAIDLDHFKSINDRFGHETGDLVLREVGRLLRACARPGEAVFRLGGEEFLIVLDGTGMTEARRRAEHLRASIECARILQHGRVTTSIGVATRRQDDDGASWLRRADERLYAAKRAGRNRVEADVPASAPPRRPPPVGVVPADERRSAESGKGKVGTTQAPP